MWEYFNPNPAGRMVGDCSVRAISAALDVSWDEAPDEQTRREIERLAAKMER